MQIFHPAYSTALLDTETGEVVWPLDHCPLQREQYEEREGGDLAQYLADFG